MYIGDYLARRCVYTPEKLAFVDVDANLRLTYHQMNERANQLANWLHSQGVGQGDRVGILAHNSVRFFDLLFACGKLGAIMVPFNWRLHPREIERMVQQVSPTLIIHTWDSPMDSIAAHLHDTRLGIPLWAPGGTRQDESGDLERALKGASTAPVSTESLREGDTACLLFTGGTTGFPKAAKISHRQIIWNAYNTHLGDTHHTDTYLNVFPLFHTGGLFAYSVPVLIEGGTVVQTKHVDPAQILDVIEDERVTIFAGVPTVFQMMADAENWDSADLSSLRYCLSGGAPMPVPLIRQYSEEKGVVFRQGFGMTEFGPSVFSLASEDAVEKAGSIGKPNFFVDARVVDPESNQPMPPNTVGELVLRGPVATTGYFDNPQATERAFDEDDYFHTGDLAKMDRDGYFFIVDRLKDMYVSGGENVYPAELEAVLYEHPAVAQVAVVGVPDEQWGEVGAAFIVQKKGTKLDEADVLDFMRDHVARYKVPKSVIFISSLPITGAGKIQKTELKRMAEDIRR